MTVDPSRTRTRASPVAWVPADAVRLVGLVSLAVAALWFDGVAVALMFLVLGGLMIPRFLGTRGAVDAAYGVTLLVGAWSGVLELYQQISWWDLVVHWAATGLVAALTLGLVARLGAVRDPGEATTAAQRVGVVVVTTALGLSLAVLWELGEWVGHTYVNESIYITESDTLGDLVAGGLGSLVAGVALVRRGRAA